MNPYLKEWNALSKDEPKVYHFYISCRWQGAYKIVFVRDNRIFLKSANPLTQFWFI